MGVDLWIFGKHTMPFKKKKIEDKSKLLAVLNSLKLEESLFLKDVCLTWYCSPWRVGDSVEERLKIRSWDFDKFYEGFKDPLNRVYLKGPYGGI